MAASGFKKLSEKNLEQFQGKTVAIVGLGSAGSTVATMLAREGIDLRLVDMGRVEEEDMHRLDLFHEEDITKFKVKQAKIRLAAINPKAEVKSFHEEMTASNVFLLQGNVIVDATNSDEMNALTISHAAKKRYPLVLIRFSGSIARILVLQKAAPAKLADKLKLPSVDNAGVFGPVTSMAASLAVGEIMKILLGEKTSMIIECDSWDPKVKITKL
jgi:molybdopterin/thiamine biosynthesis adenylyltransferase